MKKRNLLCVFGALAALTLASCGKTATPTPTPTPTEEKEYDANALVATFDESINTTVKLTYNVSFDVDVVREGNDATNFDSFKHKTRSTTQVEMDLGEDLYIKVTKTTKDLLVSNDAKEFEEVFENGIGWTFRFFRVPGGAFCICRWTFRMAPQGPKCDVLFRRQ